MRDRVRKKNNLSRLRRSNRCTRPGLQLGLVRLDKERCFATKLLKNLPGPCVVVRAFVVRERAPRRYTKDARDSRFVGENVWAFNVRLLVAVVFVDGVDKVRLSFWIEIRICPKIFVLNVIIDDIQ